MRAKVYKKFSIYLLILFGGLQITAEIHNYNHKDDLRCREKIALHLHSSQHHCNLCGIPLTPAVTFESPTLTIYPVQSFKELYKGNIVLPITRHSHLLRAPPVIG